LAGCNPSPRTDPDDLYKSIYADYLHGSLEEAHSRAEAARNAYAGTGPDDNPVWEVKFRLLAADILLRQGHPKAVTALLSGNGASIPTAGDSAIKWRALSGLAHWRLKLLEDSSRELHEARDLAESTHSEALADVLRSEALIARDSGLAAESLEKFQSSLKIAQHSGDQLLQAVDLIDIGFASLQARQYDQALRLLQDAADFAISIQARRQLQFALGNIGWADYNLGDFDGALTNFLAAEQLTQELGMVDKRVLWLQDAGLAEYRLDHWQQAQQYDEEALRIALSLPADDEADQIANTQTNLALLLYGEGKYEAAKQYGDAAAQAAHVSKDNNVIAYAIFLQGLVATRQAGTVDAESLLQSAWRLATDPDLRADIENALGNLHAARHEVSAAELWYRRSIQTFEARRSTVRDEALRLSVFAYGDAIYRNYAEFLIQARRPNEALQLLDRSRARTLEEGLGFPDAEIAVRANEISPATELAKKLDATLLFYSLGPDNSYLWVITAHDTRLFPLARQSAIRSLLETHQRAVQRSMDPLESASGSTPALYDALIKPAAAMIPAGARVFIVPDGILRSLNFETLLVPTTHGFRYWIEDVTVTVTSSIRLLSRPRAALPKSTMRDLLLIGDPLQAQRDFTTLPNAATEMQHVEQHFSPDEQTVLGRSQAVPSAYSKSTPGQYRYIHFVAHGTASQLSPLDSAVILSPSPTDPADFKLYARDVMRYPLQARLVTVSACNSSGVRNYVGEGLVGLSWAFLRAGAHNVIAALWLADDAATPLLMDQLYSELKSGKNPDEALRLAKLGLIHSSSVYRKPYYWGAFQLYAGS
jgi:CHAT domain-containing protein